MPVTRSARKKLRQDRVREIQNLVLKNKAKKAIRLYKDTPSQKNLADVYSILDTFSKKKVYHANKIARLKSRLSKRLNKKSKSKSTDTVTIKKRSPRKKKSVV